MFDHYMGHPGTGGHHPWHTFDWLLGQSQRFTGREWHHNHLPAFDFSTGGIRGRIVAVDWTSHRKPYRRLGRQIQLPRINFLFDRIGNRFRGIW